MTTRLKAEMTNSSKRSHAAQPGLAPSVSRWSQTLRFEDTLAKRSRDRSLPKRERTRYLILAIVAHHVQASPATRPTVEAILQEAGLSRGTFYNYFNDMDECLSSLLTLFIQHATYDNIDRNPRKHRSSLESVYEANLAYCRAYESNAGLFALFSQFSSRDENLLRLRENLNAEMVERIVAVVAHRRGRAFDEGERRRFEGVLRMLVAMTIEVLRERFVHQDALMKQSFPTVQSLASGLTEIWYRTMMAYEDPAAYPAISIEGA
jgi:AcrR family transcriptional regulator